MAYLFHGLLGLLDLTAGSLLGICGLNGGLGALRHGLGALGGLNWKVTWATLNFHSLLKHTFLNLWDYGSECEQLFVLSTQRFRNWIRGLSSLK